VDRADHRRSRRRRGISLGEKSELFVEEWLMSIQAGKPAPKTPAEFEKKGMLATGVEYGGGMHREFTVGPLTVDAELAAEADMPDWIDANLLFRYAVSGLDEKERIESGLKAEVLTEAERRKAARMSQARWRYQVMHRVTRLGGVPPEDIVAAIRLLVASDLHEMLTTAREVDDAVDTFREKNAQRVDADSKTGAAGHSAGAGDAHPL